MSVYFNGLSSVESIKAEYRRLAKQLHPDIGGSEEAFKLLNNDYHQALKRCDGQTTDGHKYNYMRDIEQELMDKIYELLKLPGLEISLIGFWAWVTGDTKRHKEALKKLGLSWHSKRVCWYYKPKSWKRTRHSEASLEELAKKYGYRGFEAKEADLATA